MKYSAIVDSVKGALGLSSADDARLLRELNLLRADIAGHTDWHFLRRVDVATYAAGTAHVLDGAGCLGVKAVIGTGGLVYYHGTAGMLPTGTGLRFWCWAIPAADEVFSRAIRLFDKQGVEVVSEAGLTVLYWVAPAELTAQTLATTEVEFPGNAPFLAGLHGRWLRYQELKAEQAGPFEQQFAAELAEMAKRNPTGAQPPAFMRGGTLYSTADR